MADSDIVAATALCYLSLLNYRNVLKRKSSDTTCRSLRTGTDKSASLHSPNTESSGSLPTSDNTSVLERNKLVREPKSRRTRRPQPVSFLSDPFSIILSVVVSCMQVPG